MAFHEETKQNKRLDDNSTLYSVVIIPNFCTDLAQTSVTEFRYLLMLK